MSDAHSEWRKVAAKRRRDMRALLAQSPRPCGFCGGVIGPDDPFDLDHITGVASGDHSMSNLQVSHPKCNRRDGGQKGRARQVRSSRETRRLPDW